MRLRDGGDWFLDIHMISCTNSYAHFYITLFYDVSTMIRHTTYDKFHHKLPNTIHDNILQYSIDDISQEEDYVVLSVISTSEAESEDSGLDNSNPELFSLEKVKIPLPCLDHIDATIAKHKLLDL